MELFRRFPNFQPLPREEQQLVPPNAWNQYPAFTEDLKVILTLLPTWTIMCKRLRRSFRRSKDNGGSWLRR